MKFLPILSSNYSIYFFIRKYVTERSNTVTYFSRKKSISGSIKCGSIYGPLGDKIGEFGFFDYSQMEAIRIFADERTYFPLTVWIDQERAGASGGPSFGGTAFSHNIQLLLEYLHRFYDRQFIVRHKVNSDIVKRFERELKAYFESEERRDAVPSVAYFADLVSLTPGYFGDLGEKGDGQYSPGR